MLLLFVISFSSNKISDRIYLELSKNNLYEAERLIYDVLNGNPKDVDALFAKSIIIMKYAERYKDKELRREKYSQALKILDSLKNKLSGFYYYHFIRAKIFENLGKIQESIKEYDTSIYHNPKFIDSYISKSLLFWKMGRIEESYRVVYPIREKYRVKMLIAWYDYQLSKYDSSIKVFTEILDNPLHFKELKENREVLNELYFQIVWVGYRAGSKDSYWIEQNMKYNTNDYYSSVVSIIYGLTFGSNEEKVVKDCLYNIQKYPDKPYTFFIVYQILKKHDREKRRNYLLFLKKAVELDLYNIDFRNILVKENG
ncbi:MAG: hypothetical protein RMJ36_05315 [Candidatus Calescibacterium sp.]|nr:hypothetical protein [Candidatus Calescibacterium sp.]MDW8133054.1 hypothetical protein [Candidatus Calescibacterium sp.]